MRDWDPTPGAWQRVVKPGRTLDGDLYVTICWQHERNGRWELTLTGVAGPKHNGDAKGSCGQCSDCLTEPMTLAAGWTHEMVTQLHEVWDRFHLNGMRAGSPAQETWLRDNPVTAKYPESYYEKVCEALAAAGLNPDPDLLVDHTGSGKMHFYRYGSSWLYDEVPTEVLDWLRHLPEASTAHPWGDGTWDNDNDEEEPYVRS